MNGSNGGPAFPHDYCEGMSIRDYFAAKAMQAMLPSASDMTSEVWDLVVMTVPAKAYKLADAMLAERNKER